MKINIKYWKYLIKNIKILNINIKILKINIAKIKSNILAVKNVNKIVIKISQGSAVKQKASHEFVIYVPSSCKFPILWLPKIMKIGWLPVKVISKDKVGPLWDTVLITQGRFLVLSVNQPVS